MSHRRATQRRIQPRCHVGAARGSGLGRSDPTVNVGRLVVICIYCGNGTGRDPSLASPDAPIGGLGFLEGFAIDSSQAVTDAYIAAGGYNSD